MSEDNNTPEEEEELASGESFLKFLREHQRGDLAVIASDVMTDCLKASTTFGEVAELTLKVKFKPTGKGQIIITPTCVASKLPKEEPEKGVMFVDDDFCLHRNDPRQMKLPLREVKSKKEAREASAERKIREA